MYDGCERYATRLGYTETDRDEMMSTHVCRVDAGADDLASLRLQRLRLFTECLRQDERDVNTRSVVRDEATLGEELTSHSLVKVTGIEVWE